MSNLIKLIYSLNGIESSVSFDNSNKISALKNLINLTQHINLDDYIITYVGKEIKWTDETPLKNIVGKTKVPVFMIDKKKEVIEKEKKDKEDSKHKDKQDNKQDANKSKDPKAQGKPEENKSKDPKSQGKPEDNKSKDPKAQGKPEENKSKESQDKKKEEASKSPTGNKNDKDNSKPGSAKAQNQDHKEESKGKDDNLINLKCKVILECFPSKAEMFEKFEAFVKLKNVQKDYHINTLSESIEITFKNPVLLNK